MPSKILLIIVGELSKVPSETVRGLHLEAKVTCMREAVGGPGSFWTLVMEVLCVLSYLFT